MKTPIAIVDCNNFYASCERVFNPKLWGKPIIVLSNNDGMIVARSNEAKALGIGMAEPLFKVQDIVRKHGVYVFSSNYALYGDMSQRVMATLEHFCPDTEIYSIDEAFLRFEGFKRLDLTEYCREIRRTVKQWTGIPVSIGIAETKTLAKLANRFAKKHAEFDGVLNLIDNPNINYYLENTVTDDVWGIGRQYTKMLAQYNIHNALQFVQANEKWVKKSMTVMGLRTQYELRGTPCFTIDNAPPPKKAILSSRSFGKVTSNKQDIAEGVAFFATVAAEKLRRQHSAASVLTVFMRTNPFKDSPQYHNGVVVQLPVPTDLTSEIIEYAMKGFEQIFREGYLYHKVGIMLTGIVPYDSSQYGLFDSEDRNKKKTLTGLIDKINKEMGSKTLVYAATGTKRNWKTKAEKRSPKFTTDWKNLVIAKAGEAQKDDNN
jgi:DNA polymerase V